MPWRSTGRFVSQERSSLALGCVRDDGDVHRLKEEVGGTQADTDADPVGLTRGRKVHSMYEGYGFRVERCGLAGEP